MLPDAEEIVGWPAMTDRFSRLFALPNGSTLPAFDASFQRGSISEQVANRIMTLLKAGDLKAGDRLPTESQMTVALGISRAPLREALKALTLMGVLESRQGGRYTVTDLSPTRLIEPFNVMLSGNRYDPTQHCEARRVVELECVRLCAERAEPERLEEIQRLADECFDHLDDPQAFRLVDKRFHGAIYAGCGNSFLETLACGLFTIGLDSRRGLSLIPGTIARSCEDHRHIAQAISARESDRAAEAYRNHLRHVRETTMRALAAGRPANLP